eukprot:7018267-Prymnesium_polylepis.1
MKERVTALELHVAQMRAELAALMPLLARVRVLEAHCGVGEEASPVFASFLPVCACARIAPVACVVCPLMVDLSHIDGARALLLPHCACAHENKCFNVLNV